jgi:hypothetical protein
MRSTLLAAGAALLALTACGTDAGDSAGDPTPAPSPTVGSYPSFEPEDYTYTLRVTCYCPGAGDPIRVTVRDDEVVDAVHLENGPGHHRGDPAEDVRRLTLDDIIGAANDTQAFEVDVRWPDGQDYPSSVQVDLQERMVDEEFGNRVSDVVVD